MAFTLTEFKPGLAQGGARSSLFNVEFSYTTSITAPQIGAINSSILVLAVVLGIALTYINTPQIATVLHWMAPILPFRWENIFWTGAWVNVTDQLIFDTILAAQANFIPMLSVSIGLIVPNTFD